MDTNSLPHNASFNSRKSTNFLSLYEHLQEPAWVIDPETSRFLDANGAAVSQLNFTHREILNLAVTDVNRAVKDAAVWQQLTNKLCENETLTYAAELVCKTGKTVEVEISLVRKLIDGKSVFLAITRSLH